MNVSNNKILSTAGAGGNALRVTEFFLNKPFQIKK